MTINQYLFGLEVLKSRRDNYFEQYVRAHNRASSPAAAHINADGISSRSGSNTNENKIIMAAEAWAKYDKAANQYDAYYRQLKRNLAKLSLYERVALEIIYIDNMGKPQEKRRAGLCQALGVRTRAECRPIVTAAKEHLTEILTAQGVEIEKGFKYNEQ